jgi:predicted PurR-regulated permease PerM
MVCRKNYLKCRGKYGITFYMDAAPTPSAGETVRVGVLFALVAFAAVFVFTIARVLLLLFAGILIAVFFEGCGKWLQHRLRIRYGAAVALTLLVLLGSLAGSAWFAAPRVHVQWNEFQEQLPGLIDRAQDLSGSTPWFEPLNQTAQRFAANIDPVQRVSNFVVDIVVIAFLSIYLAFQPALYKKGLLLLTPRDSRDRVRAGIAQLGRTLWRWFIGRLIAMAVIGLLVFIVLWIIGFPLAFTLGLCAGIFEFIPYVGAILSGIPALLIAVSRGTTSVWVVLGLYLVVHAIDGYIVVPLVERKAVHIPPALTIVVQLAMYITAGLLGVLVADPLAACILACVQQFYIQDKASSVELRGSM